MKHMLLILATLCSTPGFADSLVPVINNANIDSSGSRYQGNLSVNQAAGDKQQQANARAIAVGPEANASTQIRQRLNTPADPTMDARSTIQGKLIDGGSFPPLLLSPMPSQQLVSASLPLALAHLR